MIKKITRKIISLFSKRSKRNYTNHIIDLIIILIVTLFKFMGLVNVKQNKEKPINKEELDKNDLLVNKD